MSDVGPRLSFDIGGTFTDIVAVHADGRVVTRKVLSITETLVEHVREMIEEALAASDHDQLAHFVHATTVASNAMLEGTFARVGLISTVGFRDELELRRETRPPIYDLNWERLAPLVPRRRRVEVVERVSADGTVHTSLDEDQVRAALSELASHGVDAVAISLINSHVNAEHEETVAVLTREVMPEIEICTSHDVLPQIREYERASTTAVNASLVPIVKRYLDYVEGELRQYSSRLSIMQSNGGLMTSGQARRYPVKMIESGPAAGVLCAAALTAEIGVERAVAFDMGGTTVKACLIDGGRPSEKSEYEVGGESNTSSRYDRGTGYAVAIPSFDIVEAGAGGGSIAWAGDGVLHVGPRSAGANPGPACYRNGGTEATVTDANVVLGYINPKAIAGNTLSIDRDAALEAISGLAARLDLTTEAAAQGIYEVANASMMRTIRAVTTERGHDPRDYSMVAFGGSGPVHAATLAAMLGMRTVIIPPLPGLFSALGLLIADVRYDAVRNVGATLDDLHPDAVLDGFAALRKSIESDAEEQGLETSTIQYEQYFDLRYAAQSSELIVRIDEDDATNGDRTASLFHAEHERMYGYCSPDEPIAVTSLRLKAFAPATATSFKALAQELADDRRPWEETVRRAEFGAAGQHDVPVLPRRALLSGPRKGPLIVEEPDTTVVVPPGWAVTINELACIVLTADDS